MDKLNFEEYKSPWKYLLWIPGILILDIPLMLGFMYLDTWLLTPEPGKVGYPTPIISMIGMLILTTITVIVTALALFYAIRQYLRNKSITKK